MKITAIVPVYNAEKYVRRCIDSIVSQTYSDWELIIVDDGSTDRSPQILDEYADKNLKIRVIHQANSGAGAARNAGISQATGDYIVFVDSDDFIKRDYFKRLSGETADLVFIDVDQIDENNRILRKEYMSDWKFSSRDNFLRSQMTGKILWGGVRKAVKTELLKKNNIRYSDHKTGEEAIYSFLLVHYAECFSFIKGSVYGYVNHAGSLSGTKDDDPLGSVAISLKEKVLQMGLYDRYANTINAFIATAAVISLDRLAGRYHWSEYKLKARKRVSRYWQEIDSSRPVDTAHMKGKAKVLYPFMKAGFVTPIYLASCLNRMRRK